MMLAILVASVMQPGLAVPTPKDFPKTDFVGGPLNGLMAELRGQKVHPLPPKLEYVTKALFEVGVNGLKHDLVDLTVDTATQSYASATYPNLSWSGRIEPGFLKKFDGCAHTMPWFDGTEENTVRAHFYWSCDKANPYLTRTEIRFVKGKVQSWASSEFPWVKPVVVKRAD